MWTMLLAFGSKHILKIALVLGTIVLILGAYTKGYYKGKSTTEAAMAKAFAEEMAKRDAAVEAERARIGRVIDKIHKSRQDRPIDDPRDSCLLSGNPLRSECVK